MGLFIWGVGGAGIRKMYLEQEEKSQYRAEGMGKKQSSLLRNRQSGGPHLGPFLRP